MPHPQAPPEQAPEQHPLRILPPHLALHPHPHPQVALVAFAAQPHPLVAHPDDPHLQALVAHPDLHPGFAAAHPHPQVAVVAHPGLAEHPFFAPPLPQLPHFLLEAQADEVVVHGHMGTPPDHAPVEEEEAQPALPHAIVLHVAQLDEQPLVAAHLPHLDAAQPQPHPPPDLATQEVVFVAPHFPHPALQPFAAQHFPHPALQPPHAFAAPPKALQPSTQGHICRPRDHTVVLGTLAVTVTRFRKPQGSFFAVDVAAVEQVLAAEPGRGVSGACDSGAREWGMNGSVQGETIVSKSARGRCSNSPQLKYNSSIHSASTCAQSPFPHFFTAAAQAIQPPALHAPHVFALQSVPQVFPALHAPHAAPHPAAEGTRRKENEKRLQGSQFKRLV